MDALCWRHLGATQGVVEETLEMNPGLAKLGPIFRKGGTVTAGNSSGLNDGAAALLITSDSRAAKLGLKPLEGAEPLRACAGEAVVPA